MKISVNLTPSTANLVSACGFGLAGCGLGNHLGGGQDLATIFGTAAGFVAGYLIMSFNVYPPEPK